MFINNYRFDMTFLYLFCGGKKLPQKVTSHFSILGNAYSTIVLSTIEVLQTSVDFNRYDRYINNLQLRDVTYECIPMIIRHALQRYCFDAK